MTSLVPSDVRARLAYKLYDLPLPCRRSYNAYSTMYEYLRTNVAYDSCATCEIYSGMSLMAKANQSQGQRLVQ